MWLCKLGWHKWRYFKSHFGIAHMIIQESKRHCLRCERIEKKYGWEWEKIKVTH